VKRLLLLILTLGLFAGAAYAHNGMVHVMGTVTAVSDTSISVKATGGAIQNVILTSQTKYLRGDQPITLKNIQPGDRIVIHATKKGDQLVAVEAKVGEKQSHSQS
jgi:hypothetical protein